MIWWIYGNSGSGKTTLAKKLTTPATIHLDGDDMRSSISLDLGFSKEDREENNRRIARLAKVLENQGFDIVVSTICPFEELRKEVYYICKCRFIKVEGRYDDGLLD
ncbi:MAG: adenylyl-sulfate kinase [Pseudomonadota bacterium]